MDNGQDLTLPPLFAGCLAFRNMRRNELVCSFRRAYVDEDIEGKTKQERPKRTNQRDKNVGTSRGAYRGLVLSKG